MSDKPDFVWENLEVGMTIGERSVLVTPGDGGRALRRRGR